MHHSSGFGRSLHVSIDIRVEGLETDSINTASRADSSMFLVLRPLSIFEMAVCSKVPFVEKVFMSSSTIFW